jgi:hypothetical protein
MAEKRLPKLPQLLDRKIYKTGQTRGADDDEIYQNRVSRSSTVLIPYRCWAQCAKPKDGTNDYESSFIVLVSPSEFFGNSNITAELAAKGLKLVLVFRKRGVSVNVPLFCRVIWRVGQDQRH